MKGHALRAGVPAEDAAGIANAVRAKARTMQVEGVRAHSYRIGANGACRVRGARRFSTEEVTVLLTGYNPRAPKFVAAKNLLVSYTTA